MDITIVICTYNRPERLAGALESCLTQHCLPRQIVIVDDGALSMDFVVTWSGRASQKGVELEYYPKPQDRRGLTISRNIGVRLAKGQILQFLDDDAELPPEALERVNAVFEADTHRQLAGVDLPIVERAREHRGRRIIDGCYQLAGLWTGGRRFSRHQRLSGNLASFTDLKVIRFMQGGSMAIRRECLQEIGGFDENLAGSAMGEDKDISIRLAKIGILGRIGQINVVHHSEPAGRVDAKRLGSETSYNYLYINRKQGPWGLGEWLLIGFNLIVLLMTEMLFALAGDRRRHLDQIKGMVLGIWKYAETLCRSHR